MIPQLTERELVLKELLYNLIEKDREIYVRLPRRPDNKILRDHPELVKEFKEQCTHILHDPVIKELLSDKILGFDEVKSFVERMKELLTVFDNIRPKEVAVTLAMDLMGLGPIGFILLEDDVEEVVVNSPDEVFVYRGGKYEKVKERLFYGTFDLYELIDQLAALHGKVITEDYPFLSANLPDGSRIQATLPPITPKSPTLTVRKYKKHKLTILDIINFGTIDTEAVAYLWLMVEGLGIHPANILVIGGTASGKTTFLNALLAFVPEGNRIITIEDVREIYAPQENVVNMVAFGNITLNDLLINALRMRPDRIIVGEVRGPEAITLFQAMNVGHRGTMGTLHANNSKEARQRLTHSPMNVPPDMLPLIDLFVVLKKFPDGSRKVIEIVETAYGEGMVGLNPIFQYRAGKLERMGSFGRKIEIIAEQANLEVQQVLSIINERKAFLDKVLGNKLSLKDTYALFSKYVEKERQKLHS